MIYEFQGIKPVIHPSAFVRYTNCIYKIFYHTIDPPKADKIEL
jgi:hypothetical protein